jgi:probable phosphoglycerate mutase
MLKFLLIHAGPTPWDEEDRITGNHTLPLTDEAGIAVLKLIDEMTDDVTAVYRAKSIEACDEVAKIVARKFDLRPRDNQDLDGWNLGLWQGLCRKDAKRRFPTALHQWRDAPATVVPPEGESFADAIERMRAALRQIIKRNREGVVAIALRPLAQQTAAGILRDEPAEIIAQHLQNVEPIVTIELTPEQKEKI